MIDVQDDRDLGRSAHPGRWHRRAWYALFLLTVVRLIWLPCHLALDDHGGSAEVAHTQAEICFEGAEPSEGHERGHHSHSVLDHVTDLLQWQPRDDTPTLAFAVVGALSLPAPDVRFANLRAEPRAPDHRPPIATWPRGPPFAA